MLCNKAVFNVCWFCYKGGQHISKSSCFSLPNGARNAWWAAYCELGEINTIFLYMGTHEKSLHLRTVKCELEFWTGCPPVVPTLLGSSSDPMILSVFDCTMDQYKFGTIKLKKTVQTLQDAFLVWQWKCSCSRAGTTSCFKVMLVVFCLPKLAVISWSFTAGGQCDFSGRNSGYFPTATET